MDLFLSRLLIALHKLNQDYWGLPTWMINFPEVVFYLEYWKLN